MRITAKRGHERNRFILFSELSFQYTNVCSLPAININIDHLPWRSIQGHPHPHRSHWSSISIRLKITLLAASQKSTIFLSKFFVTSFVKIHEQIQEQQYKSNNLLRFPLRRNSLGNLCLKFVRSRKPYFLNVIYILSSIEKNK